MKSSDKKDDIVHIVIDNVQHALTLSEIEMLKPIITYFHADKVMKFTMKDNKTLTGKVKEYSYEEIVAPVEEIIPLAITLETGETIMFYEIRNVTLA